MAIGDDFAIDYTNKRIYHASGTAVYTTNQLYSWLMDEFDELYSMDDDVPMSAQTPTAYRMINGWFLDIGEDSEAHKYLSGGAIETLGYNGAIRMLKLEDFNSQTLTSSDIGGEVGYSGGTPSDTGTLLGYDNTNYYLWVRTTDSFSNTATDIDIDDTTTLGDLIDSGGSLTGEELYANVYTLGTIESTPYAQIYIFQDGARIAEWSDKTNWDRGHIDVLIQVKEMGVEIDSAIITVFTRQSGDSFDNFEIDLTDGGRNPVPLTTSDDINDTIGDYYLLYDNEAAGGFSANDVVHYPQTGVPTFYGVVVSVDDWGSEGLLILRGVKGTIADNNALYVSGTQKGQANGTLGDTYLEYDNEATGFTTLGQTITGGTSTAKRLLRGVQDDGGTGKLVLQVDPSATKDTTYKDWFDTYDDDEQITGSSEGQADVDGDSVTITSGFGDITIAFVNGTATHGGTSGTFTEGEEVTWNDGSAQSGVVIYDSGSAITLGNCTSTSLNGNLVTGTLSGASCTPSQDLQSAHTHDQAFDQQSGHPYDVHIYGGSIYEAGRPLDEIYQYLKYICRDGSSFSMYTVVSGTITVLQGQEYIIAYTGYAPIKAAPFGTLAGGVFFGAQGVWLEGQASADDNNRQLKDSGNVIRTPYTSVVVRVGNTVSGDRVGVFLDDGSGGIDKDTYTSANTGNDQGDSTFVITASLPIDTPPDGAFIVVDTSANEEHRYRYDSWSTSTFTLPTKRSGTATSGSSGTTLIDSGATFQTWQIQYGDIIRRTNGAGGWAYVAEVVSQTELTTTVLSLGSGWAQTETYELNALVVTYDNTDTVYVPYIHEKATGGYVEISILYYVNRDVIVRVRNVEDATPIEPFQTTSEINTGGMNVSTIRNEDTIYQ